MCDVCSAAPNATLSTSHTLPGFLPLKLFRLSYSLGRSRTASAENVGSPPGLTYHIIVSCLFVNFLVNACPPQYRQMMRSHRGNPSRPSRNIS